ncbi:hypothetical protein ANCCAN_00495 [Ancylostoma caninum]|uniref:Fibrinogen C-terminal domain-containing protein n=1 Tax=Ancylostoma caninum TaxID=29170 RepID=A0A368HDE1_ANCCA|nr:hypothetical protein ANCCAN_00495 [Ancylostoma caninum]
MVTLTANSSYNLLIELCCGGKLVEPQLFYENFKINPGPDYTLSAVAKDRPSIGLDFYSTNNQKKDINAKFATYESMTEDERDNCDILKYYGGDENAENPILDAQTGGWWFGSCGNNLNGKFVASKDGNCKLAENFEDGTAGIEMTITKEMTPPGRAFQGVSYDRVRMAIYKPGPSGEFPAVSSNFCKS